MRLAAFALLAAGACAQNVDLSGVWMVDGSPNISAEPAYQPWAQKLYAERKANPNDDPEKYCLPDGVTRVTALPYKIVQTPKLVVVLSEGNTHSFRRFFLDGRAHPKDEDPSWTGHSTGRWEGGTLVVETVNFNDRTWLDGTGKPHSDAMRIVERYRRPSRERLEVDYMIEDSKALTKPFTFRRVFALTNREIREAFCTDTNHLVKEPRP